MERFIHRFESATRARQAEMLGQLFRQRETESLKEKELEKLRASHRLLLRPRQIGRIVLFWVLTIPAASLLGAAIQQAMARLA